MGASFDEDEEEEQKNDIELIYQFNKDDDLKIIFGYNFVENNKDKCKIIYNNKIYKLNAYFSKIDPNNKNNLISLKLRGFNKVTNMREMFAECITLSNLPDISNLKTSNIKDNIIFRFCNYHYDISYMFSNCFSLTSLPDISKWNINNVSNLGSIFSFCSYLSSLPDISKWNTNKSYLYE